MKTKLNMPICYYPTKVIFVDDDLELLKDLVQALDINVHCDLFDSPTEALYFIESSKQQENLKACVSLKELDINDIIAKYVSKSSRFEELGILVADYDMPGMDGMELSRKLDSINIRKILLSGKADEKSAVLAFNQGIIDRYIAKQNPFVLESLETYIHELQKSYHGTHYLNMFDNRHGTPVFMTDVLFQEFFERLCTKYETIEFYFSQLDSAYVLVDHDGRIFILYISANKEDLLKHQKSPKHTIKRLPTGNTFYYLFTEHIIDGANIISFAEYKKSINQKHKTLSEAISCKMHTHLFYMSYKGSKVGLTKREAQCLYFILKGYSSEQIAEKFYLSRRTIEGYTAQIREKFHVESKYKLITELDLNDLKYS